MDNTDTIEDEEICRMMLSGSTECSDAQLAAFMQRFNLDRETVEAMPAFQEHCKILFRDRLKE
jgi:hypothetical protein